MTVIRALIFEMAGMNEKMDSIAIEISQIQFDHFVQQDDRDHSWTGPEEASIKQKQSNDVTTLTPKEELHHFMQTLNKDVQKTSTYGFKDSP